jgi:hypothetical protein
MLAPLNGVIAAGIDDLTSSGESDVILWRWESGISNSTVVSPPTTEGEPSMNSSNTTITINETPALTP